MALYLELQGAPSAPSGSFSAPCAAYAPEPLLCFRPWPWLADGLTLS